jgi:fructose-bisphosphate aldolase/2-amino-3,7-dideoxy-D-threo-hept-6-ulosonate synthase
MESGKNRRLRRIIRSDLKTLVIAMDHGITVGPVAGLEDMQETVRRVVNGGADAVLFHKGIAKHVDTLGSGLIVHVSASTKLGSKPNLKVDVCTVAEAIALGADAVSVHINVGSEEEHLMLQSLGVLSRECDSFGIPLLAMMYPRGPNIKDDHELGVVSHAARIGAELGADIVKTVYTGDVDSFRRVVKSCPVPVVVAGGAKTNSDREVLELGEDSMKAGAAGLSFGRNVFQHANPEAMTRALVDVVHNGISAAQALKTLDASSK